ncbi:Transmembrane protein 230 [Sciurus carolinensis]|uniref:Transmembrane protein 230 n=2 Tax=Sciurus TaxID=10001 RepID=A0AA41SVD9_SCICA|nr:Transmembrane protein 230 [Sciurus carolinensis]
MTHVGGSLGTFACHTEGGPFRHHRAKPGHVPTLAGRYFPRQRATLGRAQEAGEKSLQMTPLPLCQRVMMPSRTNLTTGIPSSKVKYSRLSSTDDGYIDLQFKKSPPKIPYKAIALATVLFLIGAFLIIIGSLLLSGYISKGGADRAVPVLIIGILVFLPGFYHLRIAYYASKGYRGYSYDDIPDFDD